MKVSTLFAIMCIGCFSCITTNNVFKFVRLPESMHMLISVHHGDVATYNTVRMFVNISKKHSSPANRSSYHMSYHIVRYVVVIPLKNAVSQHRMDRLNLSRIVLIQNLSCE